MLYLLASLLIREDSPFCLTRAITRTMSGLCSTPLSLVSAICTLRHGELGRTVAGAAMLYLLAGLLITLLNRIRRFA